MHGLIFETSVWLLAESTRLITTKTPVAEELHPRLLYGNSLRQHPTCSSPLFSLLHQQLAFKPSKKKPQDSLFSLVHKELMPKLSKKIPKPSLFWLVHQQLMSKLSKKTHAKTLLTSKEIVQVFFVQRIYPIMNRLPSERPTRTGTKRQNQPHIPEFAIMCNMSRSFLIFC